ncbi:MAG: hypothetical protein ACR2HC_07350 [Thermoleophilaceae bacterium]
MAKTIQVRDVPDDVLVPARDQERSARDLLGLEVTRDSSDSPAHFAIVRVEDITTT